MEHAFEKHPGLVGRDKSNPLKVTFVALQDGTRIENKRQLAEVLQFLASQGAGLPD